MTLPSAHSSTDKAVAAAEVFNFPLSYSQQRLWFLQQMDPGSIVYNLPYRVRLIGELNVRAVERALQEIVRRHEVLRTCFPVRDGQAVQQVTSRAEFNLQSVDLAEAPKQQRESIGEGLLQWEARRLFDLEHGPLLRGCLLRLGHRDQILLVTMHHIVTDGWSVGIFAGEFGVLYEAYQAGRESPLAELSIQYADYALWQRKWLTGELLEKQISYWRVQLRGVATLELPLDHPRTAMLRHRGGSVRFTLGTKLTEALNALSCREGVTLFMLALAAFQALLSRYAGQEDVAVGSVIANRNRAAVERLIGFFVNTLVLRADLSGDPSFRELLARVRAVTLGAYAHQDVPFEKLVEELAPERDMSRTPLFQAMLVLQNMPEGRLELPNLRLQPQDLELDIAKFDLNMTLGESGIASEGMVGSCSYNNDLFDRETVVCMVDQFKELLRAVIQKPDSRLSELPFKPARQNILETYGDYSVEMDSAQSFRFDWNVPS